ncbi:MAG: hypothetical protein J0L92_16805 [Deltaproteobacteria bacterium]|nr:hypothetical protein [Deltaproteobacteria bacterium]
MDDRELNREIERAQRNAKKLAALQAENERTTAEVAALLGTPPSAALPTPTPYRPTYALRG